MDVPQPRRGTLREFLAAQADDNGRTSGKFFAPIGRVLGVSPDRAGDQPLVGGEILVGTDVDQGRGVGRTDQSEQLVWRYRAIG